MHRLLLLFFTLGCLQSQAQNVTEIQTVAQPQSTITWVTNCANKSFCLLPNSCTTGYCAFAERAVTTCSSPILSYSYKIDLDNNGSIDIQSSSDSIYGTYNLGTNKITWRVTDNCGAASTCSYLFTIKDCQPPNMLCINGLTQGIDPPLCSETFMASTFIQSMSDNCTPTNQLKVGIRKFGSGTGFPTETSVSYGRCDIGTNFVEVWVKDGNGLTNSCQNYVLVQPNSGGCDCNPDADIFLQACARTSGNKKIPLLVLKSSLISTGGVQTAVNKIRQVNVPDSCGMIHYDKLPFGGNYRTVIRAERTGDNNPLNGVSTFDLLLISKHILNIQPLQNFYQILAADVNRSSSVTTFDIVEIRKLLLGIYDTLPGLPSWRVIRAMPNPSDLLAFGAVQDSFVFNFNNIQGDTTLNNLNFIAVKYGDINQNASGLASEPDDRDELPKFPIALNDIDLQAGETVEIPVRFAQKKMAEGWQLALQIDPNIARVESVEGLSDEYYTLGPDGLLRALWFDAYGPNNGTEQLFRLKLNVLQSARLSDALQLDERALKPEWYGHTENNTPVRQGLGLQWYQTIGSTDQISLPSPNPVGAETAFHIYLTEASLATLSIYDEAGRIIYTYKTDMDQGSGILNISGDVFPGPGVYGYKIQAGEAVLSGKLLRF
ncbi:MAG: T9SS type A sorting domain-containing protein [Bacteroidota bacterium]